MKEPIHILGIAGSLRQRSYNKLLLQAAAELLPPPHILEIYTLHDIPFFNVDVEAEGLPATVQDFHDRIRAADALLIATPEYNYSIPGVLKNALDWASRRGGETSAPIDHKPTAIMGAGGRFGTVLAQRHLRDILIHNAMPVVVSPQVTVATAYQEFDEDGTLANDRYRDQIRRLLFNLITLVQQRFTSESLWQI